MSNLDEIIDQANSLQAQSNHEAAIPLLEEAVNLLKPAEDLRLAALLNDLGFSYVMAGQPQKAYACNKEALIVAVGSENSAETARALIDMSYIERKNNLLEVSRHSLELALKTETGRTFLRGKALDFLARSYAETVDNHLTIGYSEEAKGIFEELLAKKPSDLNLKRRLGDASLVLGNAYLFAKEIGKAEPVLNDACQIYKDINDPRGIYNAAATLGLLEIKKNNASKAIEWYNTALATQNDAEKSHQENITVVSLRLAYAHLVSGDISSAIPLLERLRDGVIPGFAPLGQEKEPLFDRSKEEYAREFEQLKALYQQNALDIKGFDQVIQAFPQINP